VNIFNNYSLIKIIKSYNSSNIYNDFNQLTSFNYICTSFNGYIVIDYGTSKIIKFNQNFSFVSSYYLSNPRSIITVYIINCNWNFLNYRYVYHPNFMLGINDSSTLKIFVSTLYGIYSFDRNYKLCNLNTIEILLYSSIN
jgi:hypothetical protein